MSSVPWSVTSRKMALSAGVALLRRMKEALCGYFCIDKLYFYYHFYV